MLYTSYFAHVNKIPKEYNLYYISNSTINPNAQRLSCVVPDWKIVKDYKAGIIDEAIYTQKYLQMLEDNKDEILNQIKSLPDNSVLLCYEGKTKFCHRHILADWLKTYNIKIEEIE